MKRLVQTSVGYLEADVEGKWGLLSLFGPDGRLIKQAKFNDRLRALGTTSGLIRGLQELGIPEREAIDIASRIWTDTGRIEVKLPPWSLLLWIAVFFFLAILGAAFVVWFVVTHV